MLTINFTPHPTLTTERLILREMVLEDKHVMFSMRSDPETMRYVPRPLAKTVEDAEALINVIRNNVVTNEGINFAITLKGSGEMVGAIGYFNISKENHRAELGYILHKDHQGKGLMQEAIKAVIDFAFNDMKLHAIEAIINPDNAASIQVVERNGFTRDAFFKDYIMHNDAYVDAYVYTLLTPHR